MRLTLEVNINPWQEHSYKPSLAKYAVITIHKTGFLYTVYLMSCHDLTLTLQFSCTDTIWETMQFGYKNQTNYYSNPSQAKTPSYLQRCHAQTGDVIYFGKEGWSGCTVHK